jgi:hypothetical protein
VHRHDMLQTLKRGRMSLFGIASTIVFALVASSIPWAPQQPQAATDLQVSTEQFVRYCEEWSEPEGYFDSDNFISNETSYLHVIGELKKRVQPGGIYVGVGPDQNLSYIAHTRPAFAIITDIRRQNMIQHLWFKALFAIAANRVEYLALLFSREMPSIKPEAPLDQILSAIRRARTDQKLFERNLGRIRSALVDKYKLKLSSDDLSKLDYIYRAFWTEALDLRFSSIGRSNAMMYPTLEEMLSETDRQGNEQSYLASEELFQWLKKFEAENRLVPIVGDFSGPHAFKAIGAFLKANGLRVSTFYTSNVEFYLFGRPSWPRYVSNLRGLPLTPDAVFIRSYFPTYGRPHPQNMPGHRSTSLVSPVAVFLQNYDARRISDYWDIVKP